MEKKIKHLEFIQEVIGRMAHNSFLIKGWCITLIAGIFALASQETRVQELALFSIFIFWVLDSYYLLSERKFRDHYDRVRKMPLSRIDFSMNISTNGCFCALFVALFSKVQVVFYALLSVSVFYILHITH